MWVGGCHGARRNFKEGDYTKGGRNLEGETRLGKACP